MKAPVNNAVDADRMARGRKNTPRNARSGIEHTALVSAPCFCE